MTGEREEVEALASEWASGDAPAGEELLGRFGGLVYKWARRRHDWSPPPSHDFEDTLQEARVIFLETARQWNGDIPFLVYLDKVYHWRVIGYRNRPFRRDREYAWDEAMFTDTLSDDPSGRPEEVALLRELISTFTVKQRAAIAVAVTSDYRERSVNAERYLGVCGREYRALMRRVRAMAAAWNVA